MESERVEKVVNKIDYSKCCFQSSTCGEHKPSRLIGVFRCSDLNEIVEDHKFSEIQLIESRICKTLNASSFICAFHRQKFGNYWQVPQRCLHPMHINSKKVSLHKSTREQYENINILYPGKFPIGSNLSATHRKLEYVTARPEEEPDDEEQYIPDFEKPEDSFSIDEAKTFIETVAPDISPVKWQFNKTRVHETSSSCIAYQKRKFKQSIEGYKKTYAELIAPGQENEFLIAMKSNSPSSGQSNLPDDIILLHEAYQAANSSRQRMMILSAIPPEKHSKESIMNMFENCTR